MTSHGFPGAIRRQPLTVGSLVMLLVLLGPTTVSSAQDARTGEPPAAEQSQRGEDALPRPKIEPLDVAKAIAVTTSATLALSGGFLFAVGRSDLSEVDDVPAGTPWEDVRDDYDAGQEQVTIGIAMLSAGIVGTVASLAWILADQGTEGDPEESLFIHWNPLGVGLSGTF